MAALQDAQRAYDEALDALRSTRGSVRKEHDRERVLPRVLQAEARLREARERLLRAGNRLRDQHRRAGRKGPRR